MPDPTLCAVCGTEPATATVIGLHLAIDPPARDRAVEVCAGCFDEHVAAALAEAPRLGSRVVLRHDVDRYPHFVAPAGARGIVAQADADNYLVTLDEHVPGAEDWDNAVQWIPANGDDPAGDLDVLAPAERTTYAIRVHGYGGILIPLDAGTDRQGAMVAASNALATERADEVEVWSIPAGETEPVLVTTLYV